MGIHVSCGNSGGPFGRYREDDVASDLHLTARSIVHGPPLLREGKRDVDHNAQGLRRYIHHRERCSGRIHV